MTFSRWLFFGLTIWIIHHDPNHSPTSASLVFGAWLGFSAMEIVAILRAYTQSAPAGEAVGWLTMTQAEPVHAQRNG